MNELKFTGERLTGENTGWIRAEHLHRYLLAKEYASLKKVLDIACGEGYGSVLLSEVATHVTGMDKDNEVIRYASKKYKRDNIEFKQGVIENTGFEDHSFDLVISFETIEHVEHHYAVFKEIKRILKPGGILMMSTPDKDLYNLNRTSPNRFHVNELNFVQYKTLLENHFEYNAYLFQQAISASFIYSLDYRRFIQYSGNFEQITRSQNPEYTYMISISSMTQIQIPEHSVFADDSLNPERFILKERSWDYKIGKMVLGPIRFCKRLIGR